MLISKVLPSDELLAYAGIILAASIHAIYLRLYQKRLQSLEDEERRPLLLNSESLVQYAERGPILKVKCFCAFSAILYTVSTVYVAWRTIAEYQGSVLMDHRFAYGRGGMIGCALTFLCRLAFSESDILAGELQADSVVLMIIPYLIGLSGSPAAHFDERQILDQVIIPALGGLCFIGSKLYAYEGAS